MGDLGTLSLLDAATLLVGGAGLAFVAWQVLLARKQLKQAQEASAREVARGKRQATIDFYMTTVDQRSQWRAILPDDWDEAAIHAFIHKALTTGDVNQNRCLVDYLGYFETLAVAVSARVYDIEILDSLAGTRIRRIATNYRPYFLAARNTSGVAALYVELEWLGERLREAREKRGPNYVIFAERQLDI